MMICSTTDTFSFSGSAVDLEVALARQRARDTALLAQWRLRCGPIRVDRALRAGIQAHCAKARPPVQSTGIGWWNPGQSAAPCTGFPYARDKS